MTDVLRVINRTRNTVAVETGRIAASPWARLVGLVGVKSLAPGYGLLLRHEQAIHTFGMRIPIDVLYLDCRGRVLRADRAMPPNRVGPLVRGVQDVLELPVGTLERTRTEIGDELELLIV